MAPGRQHLRFVAPRSAYSPRAGDENLAGIQRDIHLGPNRSYGGERHQWCARRGGAGVAWRLSRKWALGAYNLAVARRPKLTSGLSRVRIDPIPCAPVAEADQEGLGVTLWSRRSCLVLGPGSRIWPNYPVTFSGYWILVLVALLGGEVVYGTLVLGLYGLGRGLSVAIVPLLLDHTLGLLAALQRVRGFGPSLHRWHGYGLLALAIGLTIRGLLF